MRMLGVSYKTAWFMAHRIREAMRPAELTPMGGTGKAVEVDETVIGRLEGAPKPRHLKAGWQHRNIVMTLVERGGSARSFHVDATTLATLLPIIRTNIRRESDLMTDTASWYKKVGKEFASHGKVNHKISEYARGEITTNTVEGYYSIFKRGMKGVYQHCSEKHLHRYLSEFDFRYSNRIKLGINDAMRADKALEGIKGKRLTYRTPR
jgi:transposase-like protein